MIGFYNYSVILTYIGLASAIFGMTEALNGNLNIAFAALMCSGLCDMFDGKIARMMTRTKAEQKFGIQIDSLCDLVCFTVFPAIIGYTLGMHSGFSRIILILFILAGVIRLGYFNVMEEERQSQTNEARKYYQGLPVTSVALILPAIYACHKWIHFNFSLIYSISLLIITFCFILNIKVRKPSSKSAVIYIILGLIIAFVALK